MADLQELLNAIPEGEQYNLIRDSLTRIARSFPEEMAEIDEARVLRFVEDVDSGARDDDRIRQDMFTYIVGSDKIQERLGVSPSVAAKLISGEQQFAQTDSVRNAGDLGSTENPAVHEAPLTILSSPTLKWYKDPESNKWYASYELTASGREYIFEAEPDQMASLFGPGDGPQHFATKTLKQLGADPNVTFGGNIGEVEGTGSMETEIQRIKSTSLELGDFPDWIKNDPAAQDLIYIGQMEGKSTDWVIDEVLKLPSAKKRFPGLEALRRQGLTGSEAVTGFLEFEQGLKSAQRQLGKPEEAITPETVGALIGKGYSIKQVQDTYTQFKRMEDFAPALDAFNDVLVANGQQPLGVEDRLAFLEGKAPQEVYDIYEASSFQEAAQGAGLGDVFQVQDAISAALETPGVTSISTASEGMQQAAQMLLRLRSQVDTAQYGLVADDLIDLSLGLQPRSGTTTAEIQEKIGRATAAARSFIDKQKAKPFTSYSASGRPKAASLGGLSQES